MVYIMLNELIQAQTVEYMNSNNVVIRLYLQIITLKWTSKKMSLILYSTFIDFDSEPDLVYSC